MRIAVYTCRVKKTMGDVIGAYKSILALCQRQDITHIDFIIKGSDEEPSFGLIDENGHTPFIVPDGITLKTIFLSDPILIVDNNKPIVDNNKPKSNNKTSKSSPSKIFQKLKSIVTFSSILLNSLKYTTVKLAIKYSIFGVTFLVNKLMPTATLWHSAISFLQHQYNTYTQEGRINSILKILALSTPNIDVIRNALGKADLFCQYSHPDQFLLFLAGYERYVQLFAQYNLSFPSKAWLLGEYNGAAIEYQVNLEKIRSYHTPIGLQFEVIDTGFPNNNGNNSSKGLFLTPSLQKSITEQETRNLNQLGFNIGQKEKKPGLFFGYVNYSWGADNPEVFTNPEINLVFFALTAVDQYTTFNSNLNTYNIDIIAPFTSQQCFDIYNGLLGENKYQKMRLTCTSIAIENGELISSRIPSTNSNQDIIQSNKHINIRLINIFPLSPALFKYLLANSEDLTIQTGDQSFIEALMHNKITLYQIAIWKENFYSSYTNFVHYVYADILGNKRQKPWQTFTRYNKFWWDHSAKNTNALKEHLTNATYFEQLQEGAKYIATVIQDELYLEKHLLERSYSYVAAPTITTAQQSTSPTHHAIQPYNKVVSFIKKPVVSQKEWQVGMAVGTVAVASICPKKSRAC